MAATIEVRNVPDDVYDVLCSRAAQAGMSLSDFLRQEIEREIRRPPIAGVPVRRDRGAAVERHSLD